MRQVSDEEGPHGTFRVQKKKAVDSGAAAPEPVTEAPGGGDVAGRMPLAEEGVRGTSSSPTYLPSSHLRIL